MADLLLLPSAQYGLAEHGLLLVPLPSRNQSITCEICYRGGGVAIEILMFFAGPFSSEI